MGGDSPAGVDNYMLGYLSAFAMWNQGVSDLMTNNMSPWANLLGKFIVNYQQQSTKPTTQWSPSDKKYLQAKFGLTNYQAGADGGLTPASSTPKITSIKYGGTNNNWFTNSFRQGDGKVISQTLLGEGANLLFPVAGLETADAVNAIRNKYPNSAKHPRYVMGADTDASQIYGNTILDSALKNIRKATDDVLGDVAEGKPAKTYSNPNWQGVKWNSGITLPTTEKSSFNIDNWVTKYFEPQLQNDQLGSAPKSAMKDLLDDWYGQFFAPGKTFNDIMDSFTGKAHSNHPVWYYWAMGKTVPKP